MSILMTVPTGPTPTTAMTSPAGHRGHHRRAAAPTYCTSEQMDLWRQVFAEADRRARRSGPATTVVPGRSV